MSSSWTQVLFFSGMAGLAIFVGMSLVVVREGWCRRNSALLLAYSAGVMLSVGFLHVLPEAQELTPHALLIVVGTFVLFYLLEHQLTFHADREQMRHSDLGVPGGHDACCENPHPLGWMAGIGMSLHSSIDGMIIGVGFEVTSEIGLFAALAVIAHKVPAGVSIFSILLHYGYPRPKAILFTAIVALATPLGAVLTYALVHEIAAPLLGGLMALAAGSFIYIAASDLIPESHRADGGVRACIALCLGLLTVLAAGLIAGH